MHFEVPKAKTFKEFGGEYLMIVISIGTALLLEHAVQTVHHRHVAEEASDKIELEIQANIREIDTVLTHNRADVQKLGALGKQLLAGIQAKVDDHALMTRMAPDFKRDLQLAVHSPALRREAWEVAVANQSVSWMSPDKLERYSKAYASMRDVQAIASGGGNNFLNGAQMQDTFSDLAMGVENPRAVYRMLNQMLSSYGGIDGNLQGLREELDKSAARH